MSKIVKRILVFVIIIMALVAVMGGIGYYYVFSPNTVVTDDGILYIRDSNSVAQVFKTLRSRGYIKNPNTLSSVAKLKKFSSSVKSGKYKIRDGMNNNELVNMFRAGNQVPVHFTFNNMRTIEEFADEAQEELAVSKDELMALLTDSDVLAELGFNSNTILAMFIPNTYEIYWNIPAIDLLKRMKKEYARFWNENRMAKAREIGLSPEEVITLASIIEEETVKAEEYPVIAGVYMNRLNKGIKLDACPTLKFVLGDFTISRILDRHMQIDSPYNTYMYAGLPPGPIRMASIKVIDSVLNYQKHDYLFFCAKSDFSGYHNFSRTLRQHNAYAREYHRELNKRKIWK
ncbi:MULTISPECIES: endolytic transglycosylase MltG [Butyricimonas]|uniref:endolytic transglycosylase MltG n=1 Tax=Butyricimonas TaxID=574697 RepID=UPI001D05C771|nr:MULTISPECIES: endolytic transglycosylase MltG [Butyricimonas]MCB6970882.1 endolytic transglycosylase MltG [Butyricimonas synergistica]MCG4517596.1 endolytic transglycosylase MltG [Butyricimonas sp. DFI.6.44]